jgi:hypothetical protein
LQPNNGGLGRQPADLAREIANARVIETGARQTT